MFVRPRDTFISTAEGYPLTLSPSDILEDTSPHVKANRDLFEPLRPTIETATAAPGELRKRG